MVAALATLLLLLLLLPVTLLAQQGLRERAPSK
jgi:hypothetical protein